VFTQNLTTFVDQVMGQVLEPICSACHVAGGQAQATRLRVTPADPQATARSVALLIDPANPSASRILQKPLALVAHGGGLQIQPGSTQEAILKAWVDLIAKSGCAAGSGPGGTGGSGGDLFTADCAGCHGADAAGQPGRPDVRCTVRSRIADAVRRGRGNGSAMPAFPPTELTDAQITLIARYLAGLCTGRPADVYASNCATCHGATGTGGRNANGVRGPNIRCAGGGDLLEAVRSGSEGMPAFPELSSSRVQGLAVVAATAGAGVPSRDNSVHVASCRAWQSFALATDSRKEVRRATFGRPPGPPAREPAGAFRSAVRTRYDGTSVAAFPGGAAARASMIDAKHEGRVSCVEAGV